MEVGTSANKIGVVMGLLGTNPPCGMCLMGCATAADATGCAMACVSGGAAPPAAPPASAPAGPPAVALPIAAVGAVVTNLPPVPAQVDCSNDGCIPNQWSAWGMCTYNYDDGTCCGDCVTRCV